MTNYAETVTTLTPRGAYLDGYNAGRNDAKSRAPEHQLLPATNDFK